MCPRHIHLPLVHIMFIFRPAPFALGTIALWLRQVLEVVACYKYLGIRLDDCLSFKLQVNNLLRKLRVKLGFFFRSKSCFSLEARKSLCDLLTCAGLW